MFQERGLARSRGAHDRREFALFNGQVNAVQRSDLYFRFVIDLRQVFNFNDVHDSNGYIIKSNE
jgi:hypothetical protein